MPPLVDLVVLSDEVAEVGLGHGRILFSATALAYPYRMRGRGGPNRGGWKAVPAPSCSPGVGAVVGVGAVGGHCSGNRKSSVGCAF